MTPSALTAGPSDRGNLLPSLCHWGPGVRGQPSRWWLLAWDEDIECRLVGVDVLDEGRLPGTCHPFLRDAYGGRLWGQLTLTDWTNL